MRSKLSRLFLVAMAVGAGNVALAQTERVIQEPDRIVVPRITPIDFNIQEINGTIHVPTITYVITPRAVRFQCLVKVRTSFLPEAQDSVSNL